MPKEISVSVLPHDNCYVAISRQGESNEGWFDPWSLLQGFRKKAISLGVEYVELEANRIVLQQDGQVAGVEVGSFDSHPSTQRARFSPNHDHPDSSSVSFMLNPRPCPLRY